MAGVLANQFTVVTYNVNGIRAATKRGFEGWLAECGADIVTLQEVRAPDDVLRKLIPEGWHIAHHPSTIEGAKGRAGVAVLSRVEPKAVRERLADVEEWDGHGRWLEVDLETADGGVLTVVSAYIHSGEVDTPKQVAKYRFLDHVSDHMAQLMKSADDSRHVLITGDINIGHKELDIKNWKGNVKRAGFLPEERAYLDRWMGELGYTDVVRSLYGEEPGPYSWWSWRGKAFDNDTGWRIDYHLASPNLAKAATTWRVDKADSYEGRISDHAPVVVTYEL